MTGIIGCCARAASGHATAAPPRSVMNSRRLIELHSGTYVEIIGLFLTFSELCTKLALNDIFFILPLVGRWTVLVPTPISRKTARQPGKRSGAGAFLLHESLNIRLATTRNSEQKNAATRSCATTTPFRLVPRARARLDYRSQDEPMVRAATCRQGAASNEGRSAHRRMAACGSVRVGRGTQERIDGRRHLVHRLAWFITHGRGVNLPLFEIVHQFTKAGGRAGAVAPFFFRECCT